jgi:hypothetical protein
VCAIQPEYLSRRQLLQSLLALVSNEPILALAVVARILIVQRKQLFRRRSLLRKIY